MFLLSQNDENQSENGSKNSKIRLRARPPAEPQKKMLQTKKLKSKSWKTRVFFTFRLPILDGRVHEQVSSVLFFTVFFEGERHDLSKTGGFGRKMPPPPGKPVTFYECHPEDHAPAPSVRADFYVPNHVFERYGDSMFTDFCNRKGWWPQHEKRVSIFWRFSRNVTDFLPKLYWLSPCLCWLYPNLFCSWCRYFLLDNNYPLVI